MYIRNINLTCTYNCPPSPSTEAIVSKKDRELIKCNNQRNNYTNMITCVYQNLVLVLKGVC